MPGMESSSKLAVSVLQEPLKPVKKKLVTLIVIQNFTLGPQMNFSL
jgi:hypothetical protein